MHFWRCGFQTNHLFPEYRCQLLHHCTVIGASNVLFIVASENTIIISALVTIYPVHQSIYLSLLDAVNECILKWAYESAWRMTLEI